MSTIYRPQGSEKIQDPDKKLDRIKEIAGIGHKSPLNENKNNTKFSTVLHEAVAADGKVYGLVQEGPKVYLKHLINDHYEYIGDEKNYAYKDFAQAFKHMNLLFKDISQQAGHSTSINLFEGGLNEKKNLTEQRFILKTPGAQAPPSQDINPMPPAPEMPTGDPAAPPADPQASQELGQEFDAADDEQDPAKSMQKLTGKLTEKMRKADEQIMTSEFAKSILNSVISAIDVTKMEDGDVLSVIKKLKGEDNPESAAPEGDANSDFTDDSGMDYNVNNPSNPENQEQPLKEMGGNEDFLQQNPLPHQHAQQTSDTPLKKVDTKGGYDFYVGRDAEGVIYNIVPAGAPAPGGGYPDTPRYIEKIKRVQFPPEHIQEEIEQPTWDDQPMQGIVQQVVQNVGIESNQSTEQDIHNAVQLFVNTYDNDQNQTEFMRQLKDYINTDGLNEMDGSTYQLKYSTLSPMGQQIFDQLEIIDPGMEGLNAREDDTPDQQKNNMNNFQTPTTPMMGMAAESKDFLKNIIIEALNLK